MPRRSRAAEAAVAKIVPENDLERAVLRDPQLQAGLAWGRPRKAHPEGPVWAHVVDLLETIDGWGEREPRRSELRFIALVHDALKREVKGWRPKGGENHHAKRARRFAERYTADERLLATIELHDRPYAIWKRGRRRGRLDDAAVSKMLERVRDPELFMRFVELDASSEAKDSEPIRWLWNELRQRGLL